MATTLNRAPICFKCNSSYKVEEVSSGIFCCRGFCRKIFNSAKETGEVEQLLAQQKKALVGPSGDAPPPKIVNQVNGDDPPNADRTTIPKFKVGEYCRAPFLEANRFVSTWKDGSLYEAVVNHIVDSKQLIVRYVGITDEYQIAVNTKDLRPSQGKAARSVQTEEASRSGHKDVVIDATSFKQGDYCRAFYEGQEYEAQVTSCETDNSGNAFCHVRYLGYGNEETKWMKDLKPSLGKVARKDQRTAANAEMKMSSESSVATTAIYKEGDHCRALYDGAEYDAEITMIAKDENGIEYCTVKFIGYGNEETVWVSDLKPPSTEAKESRPESNEVKVSQSVESFKVGDHCRGTYEGVEYEAEITSIESDENGDKYCVIKFVGYGNEETLWLADLKPSLGEGARKAQQNSIVGEEQITTQNTVSYKAGDFCRVLFEEVEYEAEVLSVAVDENGSEYGTVRYLGYGNESTVWTCELKPSLGDEARKAQISTTSPETQTTLDQQEPKSSFKVGDYCRSFVDDNEYEAEILSVAQDDNAVEYCNIKLIGYESETTVWMADLKLSLGKESRDAQLAMASGNQLEETSLSFKVGDFCRYNSEGSDYEAEITAIDVDDNGMKYCTIKYLGYETEDTVWLSDLKESMGEKSRQSQKELASDIALENEKSTITADRAQTEPIQHQSTKEKDIEISQVSANASNPSLDQETKSATIVHNTTSTNNVCGGASASTPIRNGDHLPMPSASISSLALPDTKLGHDSQNVHVLQDLCNRLLAELDLAGRNKVLESRLSEANQLPTGSLSNNELERENENLRITVHSITEGNKELVEKNKKLEEQLCKKSQMPSSGVSADEVKKLQDKLAMYEEIKKVSKENLMESQKRCLALEDQVKDWRKKYQDKIEQASSDTGMLFKKVESLEQENNKLLKQNKDLQNEILNLKLSSL